MKSLTSFGSMTFMAYWLSFFPIPATVCVVAYPVSPSTPLRQNPASTCKTKSMGSVHLFPLFYTLIWQNLCVSKIKRKMQQWKSVIVTSSIMKWTYWCCGFLWHAVAISVQARVLLGAVACPSPAKTTWPHQDRISPRMHSIRLQSTEVP